MKNHSRSFRAAFTLEDFDYHDSTSRGCIYSLLVNSHYDLGFSHHFKIVRLLNIFFFNSFIGMVPYMGPTFAIRFATRCRTKKFKVNCIDLYIVQKPASKAIFLGFELC